LVHVDDGEGLPTGTRRTLEGGVVADDQLELKGLVEGGLFDGTLGSHGSNLLAVRWYFAGTPLVLSRYEMPNAGSTARCGSTPTANSGQTFGNAKSVGERRAVVVDGVRRHGVIRRKRRSGTSVNITRRTKNNVSDFSGTWDASLVTPTAAGMIETLGKSCRGVVEAREGGPGRRPQVVGRGQGNHDRTLVRGYPVKNILFFGDNARNDVARIQQEGTAFVPFDRDDVCRNKDRVRQVLLEPKLVAGLDGEQGKKYSGGILGGQLTRI
jgi:hypothetical protein